MQQSLRLGRDDAGRWLVLWGKPPHRREATQKGTLSPWHAARPAAIDTSLQRALHLPGGGWFVLEASADLGRGPRSYIIENRAWVVWRSDAGVHAAPDRCPHMGAALSKGSIRHGKIVCPWHGLALSGHPRSPAIARSSVADSDWAPLPVFDDGVLLWVQLAGEAPTARPPLPVRPAASIVSIVQRRIRCEPRDVLANRLDPWHGVPFHAHSFSALKVLADSPENLLVRVVFRVAGRLGVEVDCLFHCTGPRTIVMTVTDGEGAGSVVETHATPISPGLTRLSEATFATSERSGFTWAHKLAPLVRPWLQRRAARLWSEDAAYAERLHALRQSADDGTPRLPANQPWQGTVGNGSGLGNAADASR